MCKPNIDWKLDHFSSIGFALNRCENLNTQLAFEAGDKAAAIAEIKAVCEQILVDINGVLFEMSGD